MKSQPLFVAGALAVIRYAKIHGTKHRPWLTALLGRRPTKVAACRRLPVCALLSVLLEVTRMVPLNSPLCCGA